jgi:hypothetical protein
VITAVSALASLPAAAGQVDWAHQNGSVQSNGSVSVRTVSGVNYSASQNPVGAVAKANQNAATQPTTVVVQATGAGYGETIALSASGATPPSCPAGYSPIFVRSGTGCNTTSAVWNIGGTRWSFIPFTGQGGSYSVALVADNAPMTSSGAPYNGATASCSAATTPVSTYTWSVALCSK